MKPRIFFDTNIMLDLIQERPGYQYAARLLQMQEDGEITVCISILSMANIAYVLRKTIPQNLIVPTLKQISSIVEVIPMDNDQLQSALLMEGPDFEDIMQAACAASCSDSNDSSHMFSKEETTSPTGGLPSIATTSRLLEKSKPSTEPDARGSWPSESGRSSCAEPAPTGESPCDAPSKMPAFRSSDPGSNASAAVGSMRILGTAPDAAIIVTPAATATHT